MKPRQNAIRSDCDNLYEKLSHLITTPGESVDLMLMCKHLERILRNAICVADQSAEAAPLRPGEGQDEE